MIDFFTQITHHTTHNTTLGGQTFAADTFLPIQPVLRGLCFQNRERIRQVRHHDVCGRGWRCRGCRKRRRVVVGLLPSQMPLQAVLADNDRLLWRNPENKLKFKRIPPSRRLVRIVAANNDIKQEKNVCKFKRIGRLRRRCDNAWSPPSAATTPR